MTVPNMRVALEKAAKEMEVARAVGASSFEQAGIVAWRVLQKVGQDALAEKVRITVLQGDAKERRS